MGCNNSNDAKAQPKEYKPTGPLSEVYLPYIQSLQKAVADTVPSTYWTDNGLEIPDIDLILSTAANLDKSKHAQTDIVMIHKLLGRAAAWDFDVPTPKDITFPAAHHFHPRMGNEWYWIGVKVPFAALEDPTKKGTATILQTIQKFRAVGNSAQSSAKWTDTQNMIMANVSAVFLQFDDGSAPQYVRRSYSAYWGAQNNGPSKLDFSKPGEPFRIRCGGDYIYSIDQKSVTPDILPLQCNVGDGTNFAFNYQLHAKQGVSADQGWFLQGFPTGEGAAAIGSPGTGITYAPTPGIYYSWPQVVVPQLDTNFLVVNKVRYTITGEGNAWIDHQSMQQSLDNATDPTTKKPAKFPIPFLEDPRPVNAWAWQFCNYDDGEHAWTGASFTAGTAGLQTITLDPYGYFVSLDAESSKFVGAFTIGVSSEPLAQTALAPATATDASAKFVTTVLMPYPSRTYLEYDGQLGVVKEIVRAAEGKPDYTKPPLTSEIWFTDKTIPNAGSFDNADLSMAAEIPGTFTDSGKNPVGWGYVEAVGWEPVAATTERLRHYITDGVPASLQNSAEENDTKVPEQWTSALAGEEKKEGHRDAPPAEDKPPAEKAEDKPAEDKPADEKPAEDKPAEDKPAEDKPAEDKPAEDKPADEKPADEKPAEEEKPQEN